MIGAVLTALGGVVWLTAGEPRTEGLKVFVQRHGLSYEPSRRDLLDRYVDLDVMRRGAGRSVTNVMHGVHGGHHVTVFDLTYHLPQAGGRVGAAPRVCLTSCYVLELPVNAPELHIYAASALQRVGLLFDSQRVDIGPSEFSRVFAVRSWDETFARQVCAEDLMRFFLRHPDTALEFQGRNLLMMFDRPLWADDAEEALDRLLAVYALLPKSVRQQSEAG